MRVELVCTVRVGDGAGLEFASFGVAICDRCVLSGSHVAQTAIGTDCTGTCYVAIVRKIWVFLAAFI